MSRKAVVWKLHWCKALRVVPILGIGQLLHPDDGRSVDGVLDGEMAHGGLEGGAVPVVLPGRELDEVSRVDLLHRAALVVDPAVSEHHDQRLACRVGVPGCARVRLEEACAPVVRPRNSPANNESMRTVSVNQLEGRRAMLEHLQVLLRHNCINMRHITVPREKKLPLFKEDAA